jgi:large subunit ribosomal protein L14e
MFSVGRICMKTAGREAGKFCIIVDAVDDKFVLITGPLAVTKVKRRKCNIEHLEPTPEIIKIKKNASDEEVISAYRKEGVFEKLGTKAPAEKDIQAANEMEKKRVVMLKEKPKEEKKEEKAKEEKAKEEAKEEKPEVKKEEHKKHEPEKEEKHKHEEKKPEKEEKKEHKEKPKKAEKKKAVKKPSSGKKK